MPIWWNTNRSRNRNDMEYELLDTGVFKDDRYFDVFVEYAKDGPEDILVRITVENRAARRRPSCTSCRRSGFATTGRCGSPHRTGRRRSRCSRRPKPPPGRVRPWRHIRCWGTLSSPAMVMCRCCSSENETNHTVVPRPVERKPVRQGRHQRLRSGRENGMRSIPSSTARRLRRTTSCGGARQARRRSACGGPRVPMRAPRPSALAPRSTRSSPPVSRKPTRSTAR